jgi:hypothetical protein
MRLDQPFLKLPIRFDAEALAADVRALPPSAWVPHPTGFKGNEAVRLVSVGGGPNDDFNGEMAATEHLLASRYVMQVMDSIGGVWGRSRLMGLGPGGDVPQHVDTHYYWRTHWRIHVPIVTNPAVTFSCGPETVHMAAGECWLFDSFRWHKVQNGGDAQRIHLVLDTVGGPRFWDLVEEAKSGQAEERLVAPAPASAPAPELVFERINLTPVMSPWQLRTHVAFLAERSVPHPVLGALLARLERFVDDWTVAWAQHGAERSGWPTYMALLEGLKTDLSTLRGGGEVLLTNRLPFYAALDNMIFLALFADPAQVSAHVAANSAPQRQRAAS